MKNITFYLLLAASLLIISCNSDDEPTCGDGIQNGAETGVDCGENCSPCISCIDGIQNGAETGVDCGGDCPDCPTCDDGIQNGNETGVDCGGDCADCLDIQEMIIGLYRWTVFEVDGSDGFSVFGFEETYYKFNDNNAFESFNRQTNGDNNLATGTFSVDNDSGSISITTGTTTSIVDVQFLGGSGVGSFVEFRNDEQNLYVKAEKINDNLCAQVNCNSGTCIYGYCECPTGVEGDNCEVEYGPAGGIIIYDKGSVSNGWRYIEVYPELQDDMPLGCMNTNGNYGIDGYGGGASNTVTLAGLCQNASSDAARTALNLSLNGYDDWYIPTRIELVAIANYNKYLLDYSSANAYEVFNSLFVDDEYRWFTFTESGYVGRASVGRFSRNYFVIRYY